MEVVGRQPFQVGVADPFPPHSDGGGAICVRPTFEGPLEPF